jgi:hypothetical protein
VIKTKQILIAFIFLFSITEEVKAQLYEFGFDIGFVNSTLTPETNNISEDVFIREGRGSGGFAAGIHYSVGQPKNQNKVGWNPRFWIMGELSVCRCGGNYSSTKTNPNGTKSLLNQSFVFYRTDIGGKFILGSRKLRFLVGPTVTKVTFAAYRIDQQGDQLYSATGDYGGISVGYEAGLGIAFRKIGLTIRYHKLVTNFGKSHNGIPVGIKNSNIKLMLSFKLKEKHKGAYWDSINWDK